MPETMPDTKPEAVPSGSDESTRATKDKKGERKLGVTLLSGFLGAGKTTLLKRILGNKENLKVAVIVNDMAEINIDSALIKQSDLLQVEEKMVEMQNGCICCTLREDLVMEVTKLAQAGKYDYLVIESTGISEPIQVAETFSFQFGESGKRMNDIAPLDTCVTVVDTTSFQELFEDARIVEDKEDGKVDDDRSLSSLLTNQVEFADVIILNKMDLVPKVSRARGGYVSNVAVALV